MKKLILLVVVCFAFVSAAAGCGTIRGLGEDISAVGGWLKKGSNEVTEK